MMSRRIAILGRTMGACMLAGALSFSLIGAPLAHAHQNPADQTTGKRQAAPSSQPAAKERPSPIDELIALYEKALNEIQSLKAEVARLKLDLGKVTNERDELKQFIADHDQYAQDFEQYTIFKEMKRRDEDARKAEQARQQREEQKRRAQELREQRLAQRGQSADEKDDPLATRTKILRQAGFKRIGTITFVGQMGYVYKTESNKEYRYSPVFNDWYVYEDEKIDYSNMTVSGSIVHAGDGLYDLAIAIAFYDNSGGQIGQTTVRVDGARPGVPYPFTSEVKMASDLPFDNYNAWVLYAQPLEIIEPANPSGSSPSSPQPQPQPQPNQNNTGGGGTGGIDG